MTNIELYTRAVELSIRGLDPRGFSGWDSPGFATVAAAIVEPLIVDNEARAEYMDFVESDSWAPWVAEIFGKDWGNIARIIAIEGY